MKIKEEDFKEMLGAISSLKELEEKYKTTFHPSDLEVLKREFISRLQYLAEIYSDIRPYKGSSHNYCEEEVKKLRSQTISILRAKGNSATAGESMYPSEPMYIEGLNEIMKTAKIYVRVETLYNHFNSVLQAIIQSISVAQKEKKNSDFS